MGNAISTMLQRRIEEVVAGWGIYSDALVAAIAGQIHNNTVHWQRTLADGRVLHLLRLYAPVAQREEVFLGNTLLNDFLFKALPAAARRIGIRDCSPVVSDLESTYFLLQGDLQTERLASAYRAEIVERLSELYFASEDLDEGFHGSFDTMLTFYKANIEPFPIFAVPAELLQALLEHVGIWLRTLVSDQGIHALADVAGLPDDVAESRRINVILANLSFFFSQDGMEMQSFHRFLLNAMEDGRLPARKLREAFGVAPGEELTKKYFNKVKKDSDSLDFAALEAAITNLLDGLKTAMAQGTLEADTFYMTDKMLPLTVPEIGAHLTADVQLGYVTVSDSETTAITKKMPCRLCGRRAAMIQESHIIGGINSGKRFNQSAKNVSEPFCPHCATAAYLVNKRLGMQFDGGFPIPNLYNVVFHYGEHNDEEVRVLRRQMDYLLETASVARAKYPTEKLINDLMDIRRQRMSYEIDTSDPRVALETLMGEMQEPSREVIAQMEKSVRTQVIALGSGQHRLLVFVLPQLRPGTKEGLDFAQKRFSRSRLAAFTLLALLRGLCGCKGPYYFQSLPRITEGSASDVFYVNNRPERADEAVRKYGAIVNFARRVTRYRSGHSPLADWILLAERLVDEPLGVFSDVIQASPVRVGDDFNDKRMKYNRLSHDWDETKAIGVVDSDEYLTLYQHLHELAKEVH